MNVESTTKVDEELTGASVQVEEVSVASEDSFAEGYAISVNLKLSLDDFLFNCKVKLPAEGVNAIWGPSGSGKTTLLRCLAGLEKRASGDVSFGEQIWQNKKQFLPTHQRPIGYVFQESSLFSHMSVRDNLDFGRKRANTLSNTREFSEIIELLGIKKLLDRQPESLSGGEKQRVAIARAMLMKPKLLLMDEPLASLDDTRKSQFLDYLKKVLVQYPIPVLYVSHSLPEITRIADRLVVMREGSVISNGKLIESFLAEQLKDLSHQPFSLVEGVVAKVESQQGLTEVLAGKTTFRLPLQTVKALQRIRLHFSARDISLCLNQPHDSSILNIIPCDIVDIRSFETGQIVVGLQFAGGELLAVISQYSCDQLKLKVGLKLFAQIKAVSIVR